MFRRGNTIDTNIIIGHTTDQSVKIWLKSLNSNKEGELILYLNENEVQRKPVSFSQGSKFIKIIQLDDLISDTSYKINYVDGENTYVGGFHTFPKTNSSQGFSFLFSSCLLNMNFLIRKSGRVFDNLAKIMDLTGASFMQFCGDQIYVDTFNVTTPKSPLYETYEKKYIKNWSLNGAAKFFANYSNYMILDDHEIANDFDNSNPDLDINKLIGLQVYRDYQHSHNPDTNDDEFYYSYEHGDVQFFVLDTRTERNRVEGIMISEKQLKDFFDWLDLYKNSLKIVVSSVPFIVQPRHNREKWMDRVFMKQYYKVLNKLVGLGDHKLLFITGDYHSAVHSSFLFKNKEVDILELHEFMAGPLNQVIVNKENLFLEEVSLILPGELADDIIVQHTREQIECKYTNAGSINIRSDENNYYVKASWYRTQHESEATLIADSKEIIIPK